MDKTRGYAASGKTSYSLSVTNKDKIRTELLLTLYEMAGGKLLQGVTDEELSKKIGVEDRTEFGEIALYLREEGLVKFQSFSSIALSHEGRKLAERIMAERFEEKERRILQKLYDERGRKDTNPHYPEELARELNLDLDDVHDIIIELDGQGLTGGTDEVSWILPAGIKEIERIPQPQVSPNIVHFHGPNTGPVQIGSHQTQNISYNESISEILPKLAELITAVRAQDFPDKDEVIADLEKVQALAQGDVNEGVWKRIQTRLTAAKTTMEITGLAYNSLPYWPLIWNYFMK
jgi:hypothetical protein